MVDQYSFSVFLDIATILEQFVRFDICMYEFESHPYHAVYVICHLVIVYPIIVHVILKTHENLRFNTCALFEMTLSYPQPIQFGLICLIIYVNFSQQSTYKQKQDSEGNQVWICPACGRVDDGTPMIGCDGCDAWYHW